MRLFSTTTVGAAALIAGLALASAGSATTTVDFFAASPSTQYFTTPYDLD